MERTGGRKRGESFHEEFERPNHGTNHNNYNSSNIINNTTNNNHNTSPPGNKHHTEKSIEFMTAQFNPNHSDGPEPLDLSQLEDDIEEEESTDEDDDSNEEDEDEVYSRGRSRSHSMHQNDSLPLPLPGESLKGLDGGVIHIDPLHSSNNHHYNNNNNSSGGSSNSNNLGNNEAKSFEKIERTGPLHQREVQALRKGLEQATYSRNKEEILEEEQERKDAEAERMLRMGVTNQNNPTVNALNMSDQITRKVKLLLLGDSGVGKSSLILRWTMDTFNPTLVGTVGVNFKSKRVNMYGEPIQVQVWDTAGQEHFHKITTSYYRGANAIILVYDVSDRRSFNNVEYWVKNIKAHASDFVHVVLVGNKTDLRTPETTSMCVDYDKGKEVADRFGVPYFETSAKDSLNVDLAFMTPVRTIIAAEARLSSTSQDGDGKKLVEKSNKTGFLNKLLKDKNLILRSKSQDSPAYNTEGSNGGSSTNGGSGSNGSSGGNSTDNSSSDDKEKCIIS